MIPHVQMAISLGDDPLDWHYEPGDRIIDDAVVNWVFAIPEGSDISKEVDKLVDDAIAKDVSWFDENALADYLKQKTV